MSAGPPASGLSRSTGTRQYSAVLDTQLGPDEAILVKINHDRGWRVSGATTQSPVTFLLVCARPGRQHLELQFTASWDVWLGRAITLLSAILLILRVPKPWIAAMAAIPAVAAFGFLSSTLPPTVKVAEETFIRPQAPIINPGGIVDDLTNRAAAVRTRPDAYGLGSELRFEHGFGPRVARRSHRRDHPALGEHDHFQTACRRRSENRGGERRLTAW